MASFFIRIHRSGHWTLMEQSYDLGKSIQKVITLEAYGALGLRNDWSIETAKKRVKELNQSNTYERNKQKSITNAAKKVSDQRISISQWLDIEEVRRFEYFLNQTNMGSQKHLEKRMIMWQTVQKIIIQINVSPDLYAEYCKVFYNYFISKQYSLDYSNKLLGLINQWGAFYSKTRNIHFTPIRYPSSQEKERILRAYRQSNLCREGGSSRLTPELLNSYRLKFSEDHYKWLYISLWLGLRPDEIELARFETYMDSFYNVMVLKIFQPKIGHWKYIPLLYNEQKQAVEWLKPLKRPLNKTMKKVFNGDRFTAYSGRKGFEQLMRKLGENLVDISNWLGHTSIRTTRKHYENLDKVVISRKVS